VNSQPIKTTSKLDPIRRKIAEHSSGKELITSEPKTKTKRARSDQLLESLEEIKETQREQNRMISSLFFNLQSMTSEQNLPFYGNIPPKPSPASISLESALERLLIAYNSIDANERPYKLRHVVSTIPEKEYQEMLYEVGSVLSTPLSSPSGLIISASPSLENASPVLATPSETASSVEDDRNPDSTISPLLEPSLYLKELELWNSALHDILIQEDEI